jgi:peroxiredoxin
MGASATNMACCAVSCCAVPCCAAAGKPLVLFFYPKAATPGCTKEVG